MRSARGAIVLLLGVLLFTSSSFGQVEKKISFDIFSGLSFFSASEKINNAGLPSNIFGKFHPAPTSGFGINYKVSDRFYMSGSLSQFNSSKPNYRIWSINTGISFKYYPLTAYKRVSPYLKGGVNINIVSLSRDKYDLDFYPDSTSNAIGAGIGVTHIVYHFEKLRLLYIPLPGATIGAGVSFKLSQKVNVFAEYNFNYNLISMSRLIKDNYSYNKSNFAYGYLGAGVTIKLFKPSKQLLAELKREQWDGDPAITVKGTLVYKNPNKARERTVDVEMVNNVDSLLNVLPSDKKGIFEVENLSAGDYKFMLEKRDKRILKANLEIIHDRRMNIFDEFPTLEMPDDFDTDNLISRDNNFSIVLREGFQHEIDITLLANSFSGKVSTVKKDTSCKGLTVFLKNSRDSIIAVTKPDDDCSFSFNNIPEGNHQIVFVNQNSTDSTLSFSYEFEDPAPVIKRQYNTDEDSSLANYNGDLTTPNNSSLNLEDILLFSKYEKKAINEEEFRSLSGKRGTDNNDSMSLSNEKDREIRNQDQGNKDSSLSYNTPSDIGKDANSGLTEKDTSIKKSNGNVMKDSVDQEKLSSALSSERRSVILTHFQTDKTYDEKGEEMKPNGYGIQTGAYRSIDNARRECRNLRQKLNCDVFIQVISVKQNEFNTKLYRVIVGAFANKELAQEKVLLLNNLGYKDLIIKKHF